jgi:hypothetical protein
MSIFSYNDKIILLRYQIKSQETEGGTSALLPGMVRGQVRTVREGYVRGMGFTVPGMVTEAL